MEALAILLEDQNVQDLISESQEEIVAASQIFHEFPSIVKDYISENLDQFIVSGNLEETYENIVLFTETASNTLLHELADLISEVPAE